MLNEHDKDQLHRRGLHTLHDHRFTSLLYGEAHLDEDMVAYFDSRHLTLCAFPLMGHKSVNSYDISRWARRWVQNTQAEAMLLIGPCCPDMRALERDGFRRYHTWRAHAISGELIAACPELNEPLGRRFRRALQAPFDVRFARGGAIDFAKLRLIERFHRRAGCTPYLAGLTTAWPAILMDSEVHFVEAWQGSTLIGFLALHEAFKAGGVAMAMARDHDFKGVTDFLYAHMLLHGRKMGLDWINLGTSVTSGQRAFKLKWADPSPIPPYVMTEWRRPVVARRRYLLWGPRTMQKSSP